MWKHRRATFVLSWIVVADSLCNPKMLKGISVGRNILGFENLLAHLTSVRRRLKRSYKCRGMKTRSIKWKGMFVPNVNSKEQTNRYRIAGRINLLLMRRKSTSTYKSELQSFQRYNLNQSLKAAIWLQFQMLTIFQLVLDFPRCLKDET